MGAAQRERDQPGGRLGQTMSAGGIDPTVFAEHLEQAAARYFAEFEAAPASVRLLEHQRRPASVMLRYALQNADAEHFVRVKMPLRRPRGDGDISAGPDRPRLVPLTGHELKYQLEHLALTNIEEHFAPLADPRFSAVRVLDYLPEHAALVLEECHDPTLKALFARGSRLRRPLSAPDLDTAFEHAGAWLRAYHALPTAQTVEARHCRRTDYVETAAAFADFLSSQLGDASLFGWAKTVTAQAAHEVLPEELPLGLGHGDFAMRNIFVGAAEQVSVIDTLARWRAPIYEDIAYFLVGLKASGLQIVTRGLAYSPQWLARCEAAFLAGYFEGERVPRRAVALFEVQALLDRWAELTTRSARLRLTARSLKRNVYQRLAGRAYRQYLRRLLGSLQADTVTLEPTA